MPERAKVTRPIRGPKISPLMVLRPLGPVKGQARKDKNEQVDGAEAILLGATGLALPHSSAFIHANDQAAGRTSELLGYS